MPILRFPPVVFGFLVAPGNAGKSDIARFVKVTHIGSPQMDIVAFAGTRHRIGIIPTATIRDLIAEALQAFASLVKSDPAFCKVLAQGMGEIVKCSLSSRSHRLTYSLMLLLPR